jgi:hypothetical protein
MPLEAAKRRHKQAADELRRKVSHDLEAVHQLQPDILRNAVKHGVQGGTAAKAAVKVSEWKKVEKERHRGGKKKGRRMPPLSS